MEKDEMEVEYEKVRRQLEKYAHEVIGAAIQVHKVLGAGYVESVYEEAMCLELAARGIPFVRQKAIPVYYLDQKVGESRLDILVGNALILELKAVEALAPIHTSQVASYLKMTENKLGLLINFNVTHLKYGLKRVVR